MFLSRFYKRFDLRLGRNLKKTSLLLFVSFLRNPYDWSHCKSNVYANPQLLLGRLETCIRLPTVVWTEIDRVSKIGSEKNRVEKNRTLKQHKVREATNMPLSPAT